MHAGVPESSNNNTKQDSYLRSIYVLHPAHDTLPREAVLISAVIILQRAQTTSLTALHCSGTGAMPDRSRHGTTCVFYPSHGTRE